METFKLFGKLEGTGYVTNTYRIIAAKKFFSACPTGEVYTGMWEQPTWTKAEFDQWFMHCIMMKTGGAEYTDREKMKIRDGRIINEYYQKRLVRPGTNILSDPRFKRLYPHINTTTTE